MGYSRLMSTDEEATLETLKTCREIIDRLIAKHDGRLVGPAGDAMLVEFAGSVEAVAPNTMLLMDRQKIVDTVI